MRSVKYRIECQIGNQLWIQIEEQVLRQVWVQVNGESNILMWQPLKNQIETQINPDIDWDTGIGI